MNRIRVSHILVLISLVALVPASVLTIDTNPFRRHRGHRGQTIIGVKPYICIVTKLAGAKTGHIYGLTPLRSPIRRRGASRSECQFSLFKLVDSNGDLRQVLDEKFKK
jgi:hypothetical protein